MAPERIQEKNKCVDVNVDADDLKYDVPFLSHSCSSLQTIIVLVMCEIYISTPPHMVYLKLLKNSFGWL